MSDAFEAKYTADLGPSYPVVDEAALIETERTPLHERPLARRGFMAGVGALAAARAFGKLDELLMDRAFQSGATSIDWMPGCDRAKDMRYISVCSPGWDSTGGKTMVERLIEEKVYGPKAPNAYFTFNGLVTPQSVANCSRDFGSFYKPREMDIHAVSEGGMIAMMSALAIGRPVRLMTANASPFDINDAKHAFVANVVAKANEFGIYNGGLVGKLLAMEGREYDRHGVEALKHGWGDALDNTFEGVDPRVLVSQTAFMDQVNLWNRRDEFKRKGIVNRDTYAIFMLAEDPNTDDVVWVEQAMDKWKSFLEYCGAQWSVQRIPTPGHARMTAGFEASAAKMRRLLDGVAA